MKRAYALLGTALYAVGLFLVLSGGSWDRENLPVTVLLALAAALAFVPSAVRDGGPAGAGAGAS
jgi:hypothetical protein